MKLCSAPLKRHQSRRALAVISGPFVHPDELRAGAALADDLVEHPGRVVGVDRAGHPHRKRLAGVLVVDDVERFQRAAVAGGVELEAQGPRNGWGARPAPLGGHGGFAEPLPLAFPLRHPEAPGKVVALARMLRREPAQPLAQRIIAIGIIARLVALGGAVPRDMARPPLRQTEPLDDHANGIASARRAQTFPFAISFSA